MNTSHARLLVPLLFCVLTAGPLSAQTAPPAGGTSPAAAGDAAKTPPAPDNKATQAAQKEIQATVNQMNAAIKRKDVNAVMKYFAPDYKMKDLKGKNITASQIRDGYSSYFAQARDVTTATSTIQQVEAKKGAYAVTGQSVLKATTVDAQQKSHEMAQTSTGLLTWKKTKDGWQITGGKLIAQSNTSDGQPYPTAPKKTASTNPRSNRASRNPYNTGFGNSGHPYRFPKMPKIHKVKRVINIG